MTTERTDGDGPPAPERETRYAWAAEHLADLRVLDAACGQGWGTAALAAAGASAVGVDNSPPAILDAREAHGEAAEFHEGDLRDLPFEDAEFDAVVCFEALTHVADPAEVLDELRRVLRPEGLLLVSAPNREVYPPGNPLQLSELTPAELEGLLAARFANVAIHRQQAYFASLLCATPALAASESVIKAQVTKPTGEPADSALYAVAAASDGELPQAPSRLVLGESVDYLEQQRLLEEWEGRAVKAEAEVCALQRKMRSESK